MSIDDFPYLKNILSNIADNELMLWSEEQIGDALRYAAQCVSDIDKMDDSADER